MSDALKQLVIQTARAQVEAGAHYLWGGAGNTPGQADGAFYRKSYALLHANVPDILDEKIVPKIKVNSPALFTAYAYDLVNSQTIWTCAGRPMEFKNELALNLPLSAGAGGAFDLKLKDLTAEQIEELKRKSGDAAKYRWPRPNNVMNNQNTTIATTWGESCRDKRHFDCIGFVNWCFSTALNKQVHYGIDHYTDPLRTKNVGTEIPVKDAKIGDIVTIKADHIGIVSEKGTAIEAKDKVYGVVELPLAEGKWTQCFRVHPWMWSLGK